MDDEVCGCEELGVVEEGGEGEESEEGAVVERQMQSARRGVSWQLKRERSAPSSAWCLIEIVATGVE